MNAHDTRGSGGVLISGALRLCFRHKYKDRIHRKGCLVQILPIKEDKMDKDNQMVMIEGRFIICLTFALWHSHSSVWDGFDDFSSGE